MDQKRRDLYKNFQAPANADANIKKVIGIVSGKGGVGKSMVTGALAVLSQRKGYKTAVLDADITGPSIPKMFGVHSMAKSVDGNFLPEETKNGIKLMSSNLIIENESAPVVWRGPLIGSAVKQFWTDVKWGEVDYMFVDMPPGTGDVPLTVFQSLPIDGIVIVTSPQELVEMIVEKAANMAEMMSVPILGLVENMSYFTCTECGKKHYIFGESHVEDIADSFGIDTVCKIPINPELARFADMGQFEDANVDDLKEMSDRIEKC